MHEASYIVVMAEFMQVTPIIPMTGIEVATQEREHTIKIHHIAGLQFTISVCLLQAFTILCNEFHFLPLCLTSYMHGYCYT